METVVLYYEGNRQPGLENLIKEAVLSHQGSIKTDFSFENQAHQAVVTLKNKGNLDNLESDLKRISTVFTTKVYIGGYIA